MFQWPSPEPAYAAAVSGVAHEMRQPLAAILTNAETSLRWLDGETPNLEKIRQLLGRVVTSAWVASDILSALQDNASKPPPTAIDVNALVETACAVVRHQLDAQQIDLVLELANDAPPANGDRTQIQQALVNLLVNAIQALGHCEPTARRITLRTTVADNGMLCVSVMDSGPGIPRANLQQIFAGGFTTKPGGTGYGLALCRLVFESHGGDITASNLPDGGAVFEARLPSAAPWAPLAASPHGATIPQRQ